MRLENNLLVCSTLWLQQQEWLFQTTNGQKWEFSDFTWQSARHLQWWWVSLKWASHWLFVCIEFIENQKVKQFAPPTSFKLNNSIGPYDFSQWNKDDASAKETTGKPNYSWYFTGVLFVDLFFLRLWSVSGMHPIWAGYIKTKTST